MPSPRSKSAADFAAELAQDPAYQARLAAQEAARTEAARAFAADAADVVAELRAAGVAVESIGAIGDSVPLSEASVAVLVRHLEQPHRSDVWESMVRSLSQSTASAARPALERLFAAESEPSRRWLLANALSAMVAYRQVAHLPGMVEFRPLFRNVPPKPPHAAPRIGDRAG